MVNEIRLEKINKWIKQEIEKEEKVILDAEKIIEFARKRISYIRKFCLHSKTTSQSDPAGGFSETICQVCGERL